MKNLLILPELRALLAEGQVEPILGFCLSEHPADVAELISALTVSEVWEVLRRLPTPKRAEIFTHFEPETQLELVLLLPRHDLATLITEMAADDRAHLFRRLGESEREKLLPALAQAERDDIRRLVAHREGTAGAVMTTEYATLSPEMSAAEAIEHLRNVAPDRETIYVAYVTDSARRLVGTISLKDLLLAARDTPVKGIMQQDPVCVRVDEDQESTARLIQKFDLVALPVLDADGVLVGIVTHDDALDIITQEQTEDIEKLMGISGQHEARAYLKTPVTVHFRNRGVWVVSLAALGLVSGIIIHSFEDALTQMMILALYMPMVADTGGNVGSQSATVIVRALALREISPRDAFRVMFKEFRIALLLAGVLGVLSWGKVMSLSNASEVPVGYALGPIAAVIALALSIQVVTATIIGAVLPLGAARLGFDPAVVASPAITTVVDISGLLIYFSTAVILLGI
jgi:magnesium transporter